MTFIIINVISGSIIAVIFSLILLCDFENSSKKPKIIKLICLTSMLVALSVSLNASSKLVFGFLIPTPFFEVRLGNFVLVLIAFFCGGILAFFGGIANDVLGLLFLSKGIPSLFFTLTSILWAVLPYYLVLWFSKIHLGAKSFYYYLPIAYGITSLLISGTTPIILKLTMFTTEGWWLLYLYRIAKYPVDLVLSSSLIIIAYGRLHKFLNLEQSFISKKNNKDAILKYNI